MMERSFRLALLLTLVLLPFLPFTLCSGSDSELWITYDNPNGKTLYLRDNRRPSLYTGNYGDCLGDSLVNVTRFDAAYYKDNMTVLFHLAGNTAVQNESLVMYIGVFAYGESRFDLTFNPCKANIASLCPLNASVPVSANGIIPVSTSDVASIPSLALSIPDFEGQAILRIFANSTQSEIGCYSAVITNGHTFAHPKLVGSALRIFTLVAMVASFATAIAGESVPTMRLHYAHSVSVGVVFAVFQHIFFTGALSVNWPACLVAFWHNFAWSGGMIYSAGMQRSIDRLMGNVIGNTSQVGAAPSNSGNNNVGGGYDITQIYRTTKGPNRQTLNNHPIIRDIASGVYRFDNASMTSGRAEPSQHLNDHVLEPRDYLANKTDGYRWYGRPVGAGMPLPGNYSGFSGTLAEESIRISNAFMTGFLWFLILLGLLIGFVIVFKCFLEILVLCKVVKRQRLRFFRDHWIGYTTLVALRTCYLGFFLIMFLTVFEFSFRSSAYVKIVAAAIFLIFVTGIPGAAAYAWYYKKDLNKEETSKLAEDTDLLDGSSLFDPERPRPAAETTLQPCQFSDKHGARQNPSKATYVASKIVEHPVLMDDIHNNIDYTVKFGWLAARFRRTRWWIFTVWLIYDFLRAVFYAGGSSHPLAQMFGLIIIESLAFAFMLWVRPYEGKRLNVLVVYCLEFSKVASVALSATFDVRFNLSRITATVIGIVIIAIQGILTIITLIAIIVGAVSSYMSVSRGCEEFHPRKWLGLRETYFDHLDRVANDLPTEPKSARRARCQSAEPVEQVVGFEVRSIKRVAKIEDEDEEFSAEMCTQNNLAPCLSIGDRPETPTNTSDTMVGTRRSGTTTPGCRSRAGSVQSLSRTQLPSTARPYRPSWNARDFTTSGLLTANINRPRSRSMERAAADDGPTIWLASTYSNMDRLHQSKDVIDASVSS